MSVHKHIASCPIHIAAPEGFCLSEVEVRLAKPESLYGNYGAVPILAARAKYRRRRDRSESNLTDVEWACLIPMYSPATSQIPESGPLNSFRTGSQRPAGTTLGRGRAGQGARFASFAPSGSFGRQCSCSLRCRAASGPSGTQRLRRRSTDGVPIPRRRARSASRSRGRRHAPRPPSARRRRATPVPSTIAWSSQRSCAERATREIFLPWGAFNRTWLTLHS